MSKVIKFLFFVVFIFVISYYDISSKGKQNALVTLDNRVHINAEVVTNREDMALGLGFREKLTKDKGMLFLYSKAGERIFWMRNMRIPIDIIWINKNRIVHIEPNVQPPSILVKENSLATYGQGILAEKVLEVKAGVTKFYNIKIGDTVNFESEL